MQVADYAAHMDGCNALIQKVIVTFSESYFHLSHLGEPISLNSHFLIEFLCGAYWLIPYEISSVLLQLRLTREPI